METFGPDVQRLKNYTRSLMTAKGFCDILRYKIKKQGDARKGKAMFTVIGACEQPEAGTGRCVRGTANSVWRARADALHRPD